MPLRFARFGARLVLAGITIGLAGLATVAVDRLVGRFAASQSVTDGLIFRPRQTISYESLEFEFEIRTNDLGLRGPPVNPVDRPRVRLMGLGDSYVLGWGVNDEDTWLRVLERELRAHGVDIECVNAGRLGGSEAEFLPVLRRALPKLRPDIVVLGLPQRAEIPKAVHGPSSDRVRTTLQQWRYRLYPNIMDRMLRENTRKPAGSIAVQQRRLRAKGLTEEQRKRLAALDERLPAAYDAGTLAPGLLFLLNRRPGTLLASPESLNPSPRAFDAEVDRLVDSVRPIKAACDRWGARLLVLAYPIPKFCSRDINANYEKMGLVFNEDQLTTDVPDRIVEQACADVGVTSVTVTPQFRGSAEQLFYPLDGHLNALGNRRLAEALTPHIAALSAESPQ